MIIFKDIKENEAIKTYIIQADNTLSSLGYTEHSLAHVAKVANVAKYILETLNYPRQDVELAQIACYLHDIGNIVNREEHAQSGAVMAILILDKLGATPEEKAKVIAAIGNHDEGPAVPVSAIAAALILADKTDVRRSRVRNLDLPSFDIHDRVNYAVEESKVEIIDSKIFQLNLTIDTTISPVMDYFEIFLGRMLLCKRAANKLELEFELIINNQKVL